MVPVLGLIGGREGTGHLIGSFLGRKLQADGGVEFRLPVGDVLFPDFCVELFDGDGNIILQSGLDHLGQCEAKFIADRSGRGGGRIHGP